MEVVSLLELPYCVKKIVITEYLVINVNTITVVKMYAGINA